MFSFKRLPFVLLVSVCLIQVCACSSSDDSDTLPADGDMDIETTGEGGEDAESLEIESEPEDPNSMAFGKDSQIVVSYDPEQETINILGKDDRVLLEGLGKRQLSPDGFPHSGFAVRDVDMAYEMKFGSFKPVDVENGDWILIDSIEFVKTADAASASLYDDKQELLAILTFTSPDDGHLKVDIDVAETSNARRFSWGYACDDAERFMGFGAQTADVDHRGQTVPAWVQEQGVGKVDHDDYDPTWMFAGRRHSSHMPIPQYLSSRGYILTAETDLRATFALCSEAEDVARIELEAHAAIHVFDGPTPHEAMEKSSKTFGRPPVPPDFAFAPWIDAVYGSENVRRIAQKLRDEGIPSSVIWSEDWRGAHWDGDDYVNHEEYEVDEETYPDFDLLADELHSNGFKFMIYFNTFIYENTKAWEETADKGYLIKDDSGEPYVYQGHKSFKPTSMLDLTNPGAKEWVAGKMKTAMQRGADGWMGDFAEWLPTDCVTESGSGLGQHNLYPVQWQEIQREAIDSMDDGVERLFFSRSGWLGTPSLADVVWAGDQRTNFMEDDGMPTVMPVGIGMGVAGISSFGHDIGGYQSATNEPGTKELYFRWTELGAWSPVMRTHHGYQAALSWNWEKDEETVANFRSYAKLHMALFPYWKTYAVNAHETGVPIWRGLGIEFPSELEVWPVKDQVMVGENLMIAPVQTEGALERKVYLPGKHKDDAGLRWYDWDREEFLANESGCAIEGGSSIDVDVPLDRIAVFAKAGSIVPMLPEGVMTLANGSAEVKDTSAFGDNRVVRFFVGDSGEFEEFGGLTYSMESSAVKCLSEDGLVYNWNGEDLSACNDEYSEVSCVASEIQGLKVISVKSNGNLLISDGDSLLIKISIEGGDPDRLCNLEVRG